MSSTTGNHPLPLPIIPITDSRAEEIRTCSNIAVAAGSSVANGASYLGRPWRNYARVVFQTTDMSAVINSAGWASWSDAAPNTDHVYFKEYKNTGTGSQGTRVSWAIQLFLPFSRRGVFGFC